jgi:hypothetical protein
MMLPTTSLSRTLHEAVDSPPPRLAVYEIAPVVVPSRRLRRLRALLARPRSVRRPPIDVSGRPPAGGTGRRRASRRRQVS